MDERRPSGYVKFLVVLLGAGAMLRLLKWMKAICNWSKGLCSKLNDERRKVFSTEKANETEIKIKEDAVATPHLKEYLQYYLTLSRPGYALLVTGSWGIGKTWQVTQCFNDDDTYYVSLHGAKSAEDVQSAIAKAFVPTISSLNLKIKGLAGERDAARAVSSWIRAALVNQMQPDKLLIFDDLERCDLSPDELTGIVSEYLEQRGFKIILIADEEKLIERKNGFKESKEKIVGQTIEVHPQTEAAFDYFVEQLSNKIDQNFIRTHREIILHVFNESEVHTLRILRHVIRDVARIHSCLAMHHLEKTDAVSELVGMFSALDIEVRFKRLKSVDIVDRRHARGRHSMLRGKDNDNEPSPFVKACSRYGSKNLESDLLSDSVLVQTLFQGRYDADEILESLDNSLAFKKPEKMPPWKVVINFDEIDDAEVEQALARMDEQFDRRLVTVSGEMLQIFSLRMMLVQNGVREGSITDIEAGCISYIDDLLKEGRLPPREFDDDWRSSFNRAHAGYVYWTSGFETEFGHVLEHLIECREQALRNTYPEVAEGLLKLAEQDGSAFFKRVGGGANGSEPYAYLPILTGVEPRDFVRMLLGTAKENANQIGMALQSRYHSGRLVRELSEEQDWAMSVLDLLENAAGEGTGFNKLRIRRLIPRALFEFRAYLREQENEAG